MKKFKTAVMLLALALALLIAQTACAEPSDVVKGIYDAIVSEESEYSQNKALYMEYFPETAYEEALTDNGFTITVSGNEYMEGSWTFTREGDYLTTTMSNEDYSGMSMVITVARAVGSYYGLNPTLVSGYINGLSTFEIENDTFITAQDEAAGTVSFSINISGPWAMQELDQMLIDENVLAYGPLSEEYNSTTASIGKLLMVANGTADDVTILLGEYGELDATAYQSILNVVGVLQPKGWESFVENYTVLENAEGEGYTVTLNVDQAAVGAIIDDVFEGYSYALIHFGA